MHDVVRLDIEGGVEIGGSEVLHRSPPHDKLARDRTDDQPVGAARRLERAAEQVLVARLVDSERAGQLDVRRSEEHTSELQSLTNLVCRLLLEKKKERIDHIAV